MNLLVQSWQPHDAHCHTRAYVWQSADLHDLSHTGQVSQCERRHGRQGGTWRPTDV